MPMFVTFTLRAGRRPLHVSLDHIVAVYEVEAPDSETEAWTVLSSTAGDHPVHGTVDEVLALINPPRLPSLLGRPAPRSPGGDGPDDKP